MILHLKKNIKTCILLIFVGQLMWSSKISAQQDTIYYSKIWKETVKDSAAFFRPPVTKEGDLFRIKDYFVSGQLQMSGLSKTTDKSNWQGQVRWYNVDGTLLQQGEYNNNRLDGEFITFLNKKKLIAIYKDGYFIDGAQNRNQRRNNYYSEIRNDTVIEIIYDEDVNGIRYENFRAVNGGRFLSKYYGKNGKLIGELETLENGYVKGLEVYYYYEPMRVMQIKYHPYQRLLGETVYYSNEQVRTKFEFESELKKTFYSKDGTQLGNVTYVMDNEYLKPVNGTEYFFSYSYEDDEANLVKSIKTYAEGFLQKEEKYYKTGAVKSTTTYNDNKKEFQIGYDENGVEIARMVYEGYYPLTGTEINGNKIATYKDGELIKEITYYPKTKIVFSEKTQQTEKYYDKNGNNIGTLEIEYKNKYAKPIKGKRFYVGYDTEISSIETYKDGFVKERTVFRGKMMSETKKVDFKRTEYFKDQSYDKIREVVFYSNGSKQSDINYKGYEKQNGKFYNEKDELIGTYDYLKKEGKLYEFFSESNVVSLVKKEINGNVTHLKRYDYGPYRKYGDVDAVLVEEIDVTCCSKSFKKSGERLAKATYKDGKPWEGIVYDNKSRVLITLKEGKGNGDYKKLDYNQENVLEEGQFVNNKKEGIFKKYKYNGQLELTETYKSDKLDGKTIYYNKEGKQISSLIYKNDKPFEGTKIMSSGYNKKSIEETYKSGFITQRISYDENGKRITQYKDGKETETIAYHKDSDNKRLKYTLGAYYINGEVIRYDKNGKEQHRALFKNNKLESGVVYVKGRDTYDKRVAYIILKKQNDKVSVTMKDYDDKLVFFAEENLEKGFSSKYINKLNLYLDNLTPESLY